MKNNLLILILLPFMALSQTEKGASPLPSAAHRPPPTVTYAVVVGISDYQNEGIPDLRFADKDAEAFAGFLQSPAGGSLDEDHLKVLLNEQATAAQFAIALDWLWEVVKENDEVIIYFSGHGDVERKSITQPGYLLCWDAPPRIYMAGGTFALPILQDVISTLSVQNKAKVIVITDACRSGKLSGSSVGGAQITGANLAKQYANEIKILSCQPDEYSIEGEQWGGGRGAFSYHLMNGLYGLADNNSDMNVSLKEIGRYLEDHVTEEVAPQNQNPMTSGSNTENIAMVNPDILAKLKEGQSGQMQLFAATASRGIEDDVLAEADTSIVELYFAFQKALEEETFLAPEGACADSYYQKLIEIPTLEPLYSSMTRNYAAALQDAAQQVMNEWMKTSLDPTMGAESAASNGRFPTKRFTEKVSAFPAYLERASELLGKEHYMYAILQSRKHFFEGYLLSNSDRNPNQELGDRALASFRQALQWQPELPLAYWQMSMVYGYSLLLPDSAETYTHKATELYPSWATPYTDIAFLLSEKYKQFDRAKPYLELAIHIDSSSAEVLNAWGVYYLNQREYDEAEKYYNKALQSDSTSLKNIMDLGTVYMNSGRLDEAEKQYKKTILLDSTYTLPYVNLGGLYGRTGRFDEAEKCFRKALQLDPTWVSAYTNLGTVYAITGRFDGAEKQYKKAIQLDSTFPTTYGNLGQVYFLTSRYEEAEKYYKINLQLDSTNWQVYANLTMLYQQFQRWEEAAAMGQKSIELAPPISRLYAFLGNAYTHLPGRLDDAKTTLDKALEMAPDQSETYIYLAQWSLKKNQPEQSWQYLEQGLEKSVETNQLELEFVEKFPDFEAMQKEGKWGELMKKYFPDQFKD